MSCSVCNVMSRAGLCRPLVPSDSSSLQKGFANTWYQGVKCGMHRALWPVRFHRTPASYLYMEGTVTNFVNVLLEWTKTLRTEKPWILDVPWNIYRSSHTQVTAWDDKNSQQTQNCGNGAVIMCDIIGCCLSAAFSFTPKDNPLLLHRFRRLLTRCCWHGTQMCAGLVWWAAFGLSRELSLVGILPWSFQSFHLILWMSARFSED